MSFIIFKALTKKLIEKVRKEWDESLKRREEELEIEKKSDLAKVSLQFTQDNDSSFDLVQL